MLRFVYSPLSATLSGIIRRLLRELTNLVFLHLNLSADEVTVLHFPSCSVIQEVDKIIQTSE